MRISVCIPTYNQAKYIGETLDSVLCQSILPDEIIVSNDCSTDHTKEILHEYEQKYSILKVFHQSENLGITNNNNFCYHQAKGDFILRLDSDDLIHRNFISTMLPLLSHYTQAAYAHCAIQEIDEYGNKTKNRILGRNLEYYDADKALKESVKGYKVAANILLFRREALQKVGYIQSKINFAEDYYLSVSMANAGYGNVYCNQVLASYRVWLDSGNVRQKRKLDEINGIAAVYHELIEPAFKNRNWNMNIITKIKREKAISYSDCLSVGIYSINEKKELYEAILNLSNHKFVKISSWMYLHHIGGLIELKKNSIKILKNTIKKIYYIKS